MAENIAHGLSNMFAHNNLAFNQRQFLEDCGLELKERQAI